MNNFRIGDLVRLRNNKRVYGFITGIDNFNKGNFHYVCWFNYQNVIDNGYPPPSDFPYAPSSLVLVS